jgi:hypothetical protein
MFARSAEGNFACRLAGAAVGKPRSTGLCASVLAFAFAVTLGLVLDIGCLGAWKTGAWSALLGLISTKGGLDDSLSATAVDCVFAASVNESAGFSFAQSLASGAAFEASDSAAACRCASAGTALGSGFGSILLATDSVVGAGTSFDRRPA